MGNFNDFRERYKHCQEGRTCMTSSQKIIGATILLLVSTSAALAQTDTKNLDAIRALRTADAAWLKTYEAKDVDKAVAFCDEQGSLLWPNAPRATGKSAIAKATADAFAIPGFDLEWRPDQIAVARSGELGYTSGTYTWSYKDSSGKPVSDKGKYLTVWKKQADGSWKVLFDMFNTDLPPS
jgi:ketosteroid isomerase-like protein